MHATPDIPAPQLAAAEARGAGRADARLRRSPASDPIRQVTDADLDVLAGRLSRSVALTEVVAADVAGLLARATRSSSGGPPSARNGCRSAYAAMT